MRSDVTRFLALAISTMAVLSLAASDPPGVDGWTSQQLKEYEKTLAAKMSAQKVGSQTLATYDNHSLLVAHREANGQGEQHQRQVDVFVIQTGEATIRVGGELVDGKQTRPNEMIGSSVRGGIEKKLKPGDVLHVSAKTPHQMLIQAGQQVTYMVVKIDVP